VAGPSPPMLHCFLCPWEKSQRHAK